MHRMPKPPLRYGFGTSDGGVGPVKGAQLHKIKGDVLKLALIGQQAGSDWRRVLCFASEEAAAYVTGKSWVAAAAQHFGVEVVPERKPGLIQESAHRIATETALIN